MRNRRLKPVGIDWWIEKLNKNMERICDEEDPPMNFRIEELNNQMARMPFKEFQFLEKITGKDFTAICLSSDVVSGVTEDYYKMFPALLNTLELMKYNRCVEWMREMCLPGSRFHGTFGEFLDLLKKIIKTIYDEYKKGEYYAIFYG